MKMMLLAAAAAVACVVGTSAFAQSQDPDLGTDNITQWCDGNNLHPNPSPNGPYGYGPFAQVRGGYHGPGIFYDPRVIEQR